MQDIELLLFEIFRAVSFGTAAEVNNTMNKQKCKKCIVKSLTLGETMQSQCDQLS